MIRSDEQIKKDIVDELYWDNRIDASRISVTVANGVATLSGEVPNYSTRMAARAAAWRMAGVLDVNDELIVSHDSRAPLPTDAEIQVQVSNSLAWEPAVDETAITVSVNNGIVTLKGTVDAYWKRALVESKIAGIRGILLIEDELAVVPSEKLTDDVLARVVVSALERDIQVNPNDVTVTVEDGIVTLTGAVPNWAARDAAARDAALTAGVRDVRNEIGIVA